MQIDEKKDFLYIGYTRIGRIAVVSWLLVCESANGSQHRKCVYFNISKILSRLSPIVCEFPMW